MSDTDLIRRGDARCTCAIGADALDAIDALRAQVAKDKARIERLEAALRPFAKAGELFILPERAEFCQVLYAPAAGPDYRITERHVRRARAALEDGE